MRSWLLHSIAWLTARHIAHYEAMQVLLAKIDQFFMQRSDAALFAYYSESQLQQEELHELKALSAAYEIKRLNTDQFTGKTDWPDHAAIGLNMVAGVLIEQHDWDPDDVADFVDDLSDGFFNFNEMDDEEE